MSQINDLRGQKLEKSNKFTFSEEHGALFASRASRRMRAMLGVSCFETRTSCAPQHEGGGDKGYRFVVLLGTAAVPCNSPDGLSQQVWTRELSVSVALGSMLPWRTTQRNVAWM